MFKKIAITALGAVVLGLGASHSGLTQPLTSPAAQAVDEVTGIEIMTKGLARDFIFGPGTGGSLNSAAAHSAPGAFPSVTTSSPPPSWVLDFGGGFAVTSSVQTTAIGTSISPPPFPLGGPGSAGSASISAGNPFNPLATDYGGSVMPLDMNAVATVQDCCGFANAAKQVVFDFSVASVATDSPTIQLSLTQSGALIAEGIGYASVASDFEIDDLNGSTLWSMSSFDSLSNPGCGTTCSTILPPQLITSGVLNLAPGDSYQVVIDPTVQAATVFEPSSILLLGSGLAGLGFAARRRKSAIKGLSGRLGLSGPDTR